MKKILCLALAFMIFLCGCYEKINITDTKDNYEKIVAFMLKEDDKSFIVIGKKYHYIFEPNKKLEYIINNKNEAFKFDIENGSYKLEDDIAFANFYVYIDKTRASKDILTWALENEAYKIKDEEKDYLRIKIELEGKFYIANTEVNNSIAKLDKNYRIIIQEEEISYTKLMLSPIQIVGQIPFIVTVSAIVVILVPFLLVDISFDQVKKLRKSE